MRMDAQTAKEKIRVVPEGSGNCSLGNVCLNPGWIKRQDAFQSGRQVGVLVQRHDRWARLATLEHGRSFRTAHRLEHFHTSFKNQMKLCLTFKPALFDWGPDTKECCPRPS
jgi:hypothetical protein